MAFLFPNRSFIISEKCMVTSNFLFGYRDAQNVWAVTKVDTVLKISVKE